MFTNSHTKLFTMKKTNFSIAFFMLTICSLFMQGCIKDTCETSHTYTYYVPVYKTKTEVRANIKSNLPKEITNPGKIFTIGNFIFLNEADKGIHVIDNTNPSSPKNIAFIDVPGNVDLAVKGNILYADMYTDLVALNISDPLNIVVSTFIEGVFPFRYYSGLAQGSQMVRVEWMKRDTTVIENCDNRILNYSNDYCPNCSTNYLSAVSNSSGVSVSPASPQVGKGGSMARFALINNMLYTVSNQDLNIFNITTPQKPAFLKKVNISNSWNIETIFPFKNKLFIGSSNGMFIYSVNNADDPVAEGQFAHVKTCDPVIADDQFAYVTLSSGSTCGGFTNQLDVLDIKNIKVPTLVKSYPLTNPHGLSKDKNLLFICDGADGLKVFDATHADKIQTLQQITGLETYDVIASNNVALVIAKDGLYQYDYSNINNIHLLSKISIIK
jgi:hypothetical protein